MTRKRRAMTTRATPTQSRPIAALSSTQLLSKISPAVVSSGNKRVMGATLSPPMNKRMCTRSVAANALKLQRLESEYDFEENDDCSSRGGGRTKPHHNITPDPYLPEDFKRNAYVCQCNGTVCDAMLTRARVHENQSEFIALQALEHEGQFYLCVRSGKVGYSGKVTLNGPYESEDTVVQEFRTVFASNTRCEWEERHSLRYQEESYTWIELDYSAGTPYSETLTSSVTSSLDIYKAEKPSLGKRLGVHVGVASKKRTSRLSSTPTLCYSPSLSSSSHRTVAPTLPSRLPNEVQELLQLIAGENLMDGSSSYGIGYPAIDEETLVIEGMNMPLGRLSKTTIKRGYETLEQIYEAIRIRNTPNTVLSGLSSHFYSIIPHHSRLEMIDTMIKLGKKAQLMEELSENVRGMGNLDVVKRCRQRDYLDECLDQLDCQLHPLEKGSHEYSLVQTYMRNSFCCGRNVDSSLRFLSVFRVDKPDEERRFEPYKHFSNRKVLWHGSRLSNWVGILSEGLRIAPPNVPSNGQTYGKGIYFSDKLSKAHAYCYGSPHQGNNKCILLLSEVALGECKELTGSDHNASRYVHVSSGGRTKTATFQSCKGPGLCVPDATGDVIDSSGAVWPVGKPVRPTEGGVHHDSEYIIYNASQTRMRYLVLAQNRC